MSDVCASDLSDELAVLQLDTVVRDYDAGKVNRLLVTGHEVVIACDISRAVANVAEEGAKRTVVVEAERKRKDLACFGLHLDRHVHRNAPFGVLVPLQSVGGNYLAAGHVREACHRGESGERRVGK